MLCDSARRHVCTSSASARPSDSNTRAGAFYRPKRVFDSHSEIGRAAAGVVSGRDEKAKARLVKSGGVAIFPDPVTPNMRVPVTLTLTLGQSSVATESSDH
eukprot:363552-Chlamydomonas_euryale.AAC.11